ncbi:hypothetical protein [Streptomyces sp. NPDC020607]|uniref:hypothetical protein n=1 Tax=Streptomyces sp. NPDC020607 TaxID=3365082 RepID=UPI0037A36F5C
MAKRLHCVEGCAENPAYRVTAQPRKSVGTREAACAKKCTPRPTIGPGTEHVLLQEAFDGHWAMIGGGLDSALALSWPGEEWDYAEAPEAR